MFSIETTFYCSCCKKVSSRHWQMDDAKEAYSMFKKVSQKMANEKDIEVGFTELHYIPNIKKPKDFYILRVSNVSVDTHCEVETHWETEMPTIHNQFVEQMNVMEAA